MSTELSYRPILPLLTGFTIVTGFIDAVSYLKLGHVFVANMTGNVVFLGFSFGGAPDISITGSLLALAGFLIGALLGGRFALRIGASRKRLIMVSAGTKMLLIGAACVLAFIAATADITQYVILTLLGASMGVQNAMVRKLAIPDVTTTVLTLTLTGIAADSRLAGGASPRMVRRVSAVVTMFAGALIGAFLTLHYGIPLALLCATIIVAAIFIRASTIPETA
jgi:uncharacterized membrane protein YoaK (UPF0700 family)